MQNNDEAEDGEISDDTGSDVIEPYTALERPTSLAAVHQTFNNQINDDTDESSESSVSSDDSSSRECQRPAKRRKKLTASRPAQAPAGKHNVWSAVVFEDHIERELKDINVHRSKTHLTRSRDVESYDYSLSLTSRLEEGDLDAESERKIRKKLADLDKTDGSESFVQEEPEVPEDFEQSLQRAQTLLVNSRKRKMDQREQAPRKPSVKSRLRRVEDLEVTVDSSPLEVAQDMTVKLHEEKMDLILRVVEVLGKETAIQLFYETQETENDGGIMVADGSRRRTPGGVFLYLLRNHDTIPMEKIREVFSEEAKAKEKFKKTLRAKRRQGLADKLKESLIESNQLPALPTRAELEIRNSKEQVNEESSPIESTAGTSAAALDIDADEDIVDIHFDCE